MEWLKKELDVENVSVVIHPVSSHSFEEVSRSIGMGIDRDLTNVMAYTFTKADSYHIVYRNDISTRVLEIMHEMVHVEQIESGRLVLHSGFIEFDGTTYTNDYINGANWSSLPWERDADRRAWDLYMKGMK